MFPSQFEYHKPSSIKEVVQHLQENPDAKLLAGGHSLLPAMKLRLAAPSALVDLGQIADLRRVQVNGSVRVGAMTTYQQLIDSAELKDRLPVLGEVAANVGDAQVQARGTLGGALAHADPAADFTAVVLALGGQVKAVGPNGERTIEADDFFIDILTTALEPEELLTEVAFPAVSGKMGAAYEKHRHPASGYAVVGVAALLTLGSGGSVESVRIAVTGATSKATRATAAEQALTGKQLGPETIEAAAKAAPEGLELNGDHYASADYRRHLITIYTRRALDRAASRARG